MLLGRYHGLLHTIVGSTLAELDSAKEVSDGGKRSRHSAQCDQFLLCGLALVLRVQDSNIVMRLF